MTGRIDRRGRAGGVSPGRVHFAGGRPSAFRVDPSDSMPKRVFVLCHYCGFTPADVPDSGACPKCGGRSWERYALAEPLVPPHMKRPR